MRRLESAAGARAAERLQLGVDAARGVHDLLAGRPTPLANVVAATRAAPAGGEVRWTIPVEASAVPRLEGLLQLAADEGAAAELVLGGELDARERALVEDLGAAGRAALGLPPRRRRPLREAVAFALWALRWAGRWLVAGVRPRRRRPAGERLRRIVVIGAYGGDHVGDTAILGGVLLRLAATRGTTSAVVLSHRPAHTARLAAGLVTPVAIEVVDADAPLARRLAAADAIVVAGGPVMDLPKVLLRHLVVAAEGAARGLPLLVERVGLGPFRRAASRLAARRLLRGAASLSVRSAAAARDPIVRGLAVEVGRDPAFDYLESRRDRARPRLGAAIDELLRGTAGGLRVGVNLRPIRHLWSRRGAAYSRAAYDAFLERFAAALARAAATLPHPVHFVFYPMNPIRFGLSDLEAAYRLHRLVGGRADLRVWEADPDVDDLVALLGQLDAAVAMRLHAAIFALALGLPTFGLDYYPGQGGKVEELFADLGRPSAARRIDTFDADWLVAGLAAVSPRARGSSSEPGPPVGRLSLPDQE